MLTFTVLTDETNSPEFSSRFGLHYGNGEVDIPVSEVLGCGGSWSKVMI